MTNKKYYMDKLISMVRFGIHKDTKEPIICGKDDNCYNCKWWLSETTCEEKRKKWLNEEHLRINWKRVEKDTLVKIQDVGLIRHFSHFDFDKKIVYLYCGGRDSVTAISERDVFPVFECEVDLYQKEEE